MTIVRFHNGQHGESCYGCKLTTLSLNNGTPKTHNPRRGNRWDTDPVKQRIEELSGNRIEIGE